MKNREAGNLGRWLMVTAVFASSTLTIAARDAYVLLSGGGTPLINNYSQLLQARGVAAQWRRTYPKDSVWIFFGIGNREGEPVQLADVRRQVKEEDVARETWLPGVLPGNRPARKAGFLRALREEILPAVHDGGTLFLFVGDHGELAKTEPKESVITLWQLEKSGDGWRTNPEEELSVTELREALAAGLGRGRVVFCMTQCYSGGFHHLGVPREVRPPADWFTTVPERAAPRATQSQPLAAGFTATDEESVAAGCVADPDPARWTGYERYTPEALLGVDLLADRKPGAGMGSYAAAHEAAVLVDQTIDKPRSSSEQFLERWAAAIEILAKEKNLRSDVQAQVTAYGQAVDHGLATADDPAFVAKRDQFTSYIARMAEQNKTAATLITSGPREKLVQAFGGQRPTSRPPSSRPMPSSPQSKAWMETIRPAWKAALERGARSELVPAGALEFERHLLAQEDAGADYMNPLGGKRVMLNDLYWQSGYALPDRVDERKALAVTRWGEMRRQAVYEWAKNSPDPLIRTAAEKLAPPRRLGTSPLAPAPALAQNIAAERTLFYRRTLAAWAFLLAMRQEAALAQLQRLIELESTPLPTGAKAS